MQEALTHSADAKGDTRTGADFFKCDGLLYPHWLPLGCSDEEMAVEQLVLPKER